jgi:hypothetical protein
MAAATVVAKSITQLLNAEIGGFGRRFFWRRIPPAQLGLQTSVNHLSAQFIIATVR